MRIKQNKIHRGKGLTEKDLYSKNGRLVVAI